MEISQEHDVLRRAHKTGEQRESTSRAGQIEVKGKRSSCLQASPCCSIFSRLPRRRRKVGGSPGPSSEAQCAKPPEQTSGLLEKKSRLNGCHPAGVSELLGSDLFYGFQTGQQMAPGQKNLPFGTGTDQSHSPSPPWKQTQGGAV